MSLEQQVAALRIKARQQEEWLVAECVRIGVTGKIDESHETEPFILVNTRAEALQVEVDRLKKELQELRGE